MSDSIQRRLAAIVAADVAEYSRLVREDEEATLRTLRAHRQDFTDPLIAQFGGRIANTAGDSLLLEFPSAVDAVRCALALQAGMAERNSGIDPGRQINFRIGINVGDVVAEGDDLLGDGVNVAARLESLAEPGGIWLSRTARDQVRDQLDLDLEDLGEVDVKNIARPVRTFKVVLDEKAAALITPVAAARTAKTIGLKPRSRRIIAIGAGALLLIAGVIAWESFLRPEPAVAIDADRVLTVKGPAVAALPFESLGVDDSHADFASGVTEQLAAALTRFKGLRILSRRASAKYADDLAALHRELGADYLLEGSVRRSPNRVRVTALLTDVESGSQIWSDSFDAELTPENILDVQDKLAGQIAAAVAGGSRSAINLDRVADARSKPPDEQDTFDCVLTSGMWTSSEAMRRSYDCLVTALERDPNYAPGWVSLAELYFDDTCEGYGLRADSDYDPRALTLEAARKAVELSPDSADAHDALAEAYLLNGQHERFQAEAARAMELNPNDPQMVGEIGQFLAFTGKWEEGVALIEKALDFNPSVISTTNYYGLAKAHLVAGEHAAALEDFRHTYEAWPGLWLNDLTAAYTYADWGKQAEAERAAAALLASNPGFVINDAVEYYRCYQFSDSYIEMMVRNLRKAGLPE